MHEFQAIRYEASDGLGRITMARPDKRNAMNPQMFEELGDAAELARDDAAVAAVIVAGEGPTFSAGLDLNAVGELSSLRGPKFRRFVRMAQRPYLALARMEKPVIAAVQGHAVGAGFQLALACDLRIVAEDAKLGILEARYGLIPDLGGLHHLARLIGTGRTKELLWSTRLVDADEAQRNGLANRVVPADQLPKSAEDLAREVTTYSPTAVGLIKTLVSRATETDLEQELEREADAQSVCLDSDDHRESVAAFLEGRPPKFRP
ncbi:MAG: enoyl-CoA hydratase/isomerase family protein [Actinomycetota bacterium]